MPRINSNQSTDHISIDMSMLTQPSLRPKQPMPGVVEHEQFCSDLVSFNIAPKLLQNQQGQLLQQPALHHRNHSTDERSPYYPHLDITLKKIIEAYRHPQANEPFWSLAQCPITLEPFVAPIHMPDGHTYEHEAINRFLANQTHQDIFVSPTTRHQYLPNPKIFNLRLLEIALYGRILEQKPVHMKQMSHAFQQTCKQAYMWQLPAFRIPTIVSAMVSMTSIGVGAGLAAVALFACFNFGFEHNSSRSTIDKLFHYIGFLMLSWQCIVSCKIITIVLHHNLTKASDLCLSHLHRTWHNYRASNYSKKLLQQINLPQCYQRALQAAQQDMLTLQLHQAAA